MHGQVVCNIFESHESLILGQGEKKTCILQISLSLKLWLVLLYILTCISLDYLVNAHPICINLRLATWLVTPPLLHASGFLCIPVGSLAPLNSIPEFFSPWWKACLLILPHIISQIFIYKWCFYTEHKRLSLHFPLLIQYTLRIIIKTIR